MINKLLTLFQRTSAANAEINNIRTRIKVTEFSNGKESQYEPEYFCYGKWLKFRGYGCTESVAKAIIDTYRAEMIKEIQEKYAKTTKYITYP